MTTSNLVRGAPIIKYPAGSFQSQCPGESGYGCGEGVPYRVGGCCLN